MRNVVVVAKRELGAYFSTPLAYVFIVVFLVLTSVFTFQLGGFFQREQADLAPFFAFHPWLYLFLVPAVSMRLWAEERKSGTLELLLTLPITTTQSVVGKFLAAWLFTGVALALTFPIWITVNHLGSPDNGVIAAGYVGSLLMAGAYLALGSLVSAITRNQVIAFVVTLALLLTFVLAGYPAVLDLVSGWAPEAVVETVASFSFLTHFQSIAKGVIDLRDLVFFGTLVGCALVANAIVVDLVKGE